MEAFDLKKALAGEPVLLRNGNKGYITADYSKFFPNNTFPYQGVFLAGKSKTQYDRNSWGRDGNSFFDYKKYPYLENPFDIVGMYDEGQTRPRVQLDLPCPLKEPQEGMWFITESGEAVKSNYRYDYTDALNLEGFASGLYFATKEDAQEWLDAMRNARRQLQNFPHFRPLVAVFFMDKFIMENVLFCYKGMSKKEQLELIYADFLDMRCNRTFIFYQPNKVVIPFDGKGFMFEELSVPEINRKMLDSFNICRYTFNDEKAQSKKLTKRFIKSLPTLKFSDIKKLINME